MPENDPNLVPIKDRKMVRDMRSKAILNIDRSGRAAYMKRRALRAKKANELLSLRQETSQQRSELAAVKAQVEALGRALTRVLDENTATKKKSTRQKKSKDS